MADTITYRLSSIDQSVGRAYVRYSLIFPCGNDETIREQVVTNLTAAVKRAIASTPILAGKIHAIGAGNEAALHDSILQDSNTKQAGRVEVRVTLARVNGFQPTIKVLSAEEFPTTYKDLVAANMPGNAFINEALTPLPDSPGPEHEEAPAFAVQANFFEGGVVVCLYLHHSVADEKGLAKTIRTMSNAAGTVETHTQQSLEDDASRQSAMRDGLSGSRGVKASLMQHPEYDVVIREPLIPSQGTTCVLAFSVKMIEGTTDMLNERLQCMYEKPGIHFSAFHTIVAVLWKAMSRAREPERSSSPGYSAPKESRLFFPVDMANKVDPPLDLNRYYGNSCLFSSAKMPMSHVRLPFDVSTIVMAARKIRDSILCMTDAKARSAIAVINGVEDVQTLNYPNIDSSTDVFITNWEDLPVGKEAGLGLGLGTPEWARQVSKNQPAFGCVVLPQKTGKGVWEVTVSMADDEVERLLEDGKDGGLAPFLVRQTKLTA